MFFLLHFLIYFEELFVCTKRKADFGKKRLPIRLMYYAPSFYFTAILV